MAKKIVAMIQPFSLKQNFYIYENGNKIASVSPKTDEIVETVLSFMKEHDVDQLDLLGPKQYNRGLRKKIKEAEMNKFNKDTLIINIS